MPVAVNIVEDYRLLVGKAVCSLESKISILHKCEECPGKTSLEESLLRVFEALNPEGTVEFEQWVQTDRATLEARQMSVNFIEQAQE